MTDRLVPADGSAPVPPAVDPASVPRVDVDTDEGVAQVRVLATPGAGPSRTDPRPRGTLLLGHGAGGRRDAADVLALTALTEHGWAVVLVDQPWRVAGRSVATGPPRLDRAWRGVTRVLATADWQERHGIPLPRPWVVGGRSAGARVACRTSVGAGTPRVAGVVCVAFPLHPPGRQDRSRAEELALPLAAGLPTLVVQGSADPFGSPQEIAEATRSSSAALTLVVVPGNQSPSRDLQAVRRHVGAFLAALP
jgi:uncharacterized protein